MGLLDSLMSPSTYGGQNGGLLDLLQSSMMQQNSYQPSGGFPQQQPDQGATFAERWGGLPGGAGSGRSFDQATFDPSTYAPSQPSNPIAVGNYQMPRMGNPDQFQPQQAMTPPNAQPTQGQMQPQQMPAQRPQQMEQPAFLQQGSPGGFGGAFRGAMANMQGGPLGLLGGAIAGGMGMGQGNPQDVQRQNMRAQYQAFIGAGMTPQNAMLAVMNPEAAKTLVNETLTSKEKFHTLKDGMGREVPAFVNERDQTINGKPISEYNASSANTGLDGLQRARDAGISGDALYGYLPKEMAPTVKAMVEGRQPLPSTQAMRSPATLALIDAAHAIDPTFDATSWAARQAGAKDFTSGKSSEMVRAANQTLAHVGSLLDAMDNLKNTRFPAVNAVGNYVNEQTGGGQPGAFRTNAHAVAEEMSKVFKGANLSDAEIRHWEQNLSENMSPDQQKAQIAKLSELLHGSLSALDEKRAAAIGPMAAEKAGPIIKDEGRKVLERIDSWVKGNASPASAPAKSSLPSGWSVQVR